MATDETLACVIQTLVVFTEINVRPKHCGELTPSGGLQYFPFQSRLFHLNKSSKTPARFSIQVHNISVLPKH